jgi:hypothetical protein
MPLDSTFKRFYFGVCENNRSRMDDSSSRNAGNIRNILEAGMPAKAGKNNNRHANNNRPEYDISALCFHHLHGLLQAAYLRLVQGGGCLDGYELLSDVICGRIHHGCIRHIPGVDNIVADTLSSPGHLRKTNDQIAFYLPAMPDQYSCILSTTPDRIAVYLQWLQWHPARARSC